MKWIKEPVYHEEPYQHLFFESRETKGWGYSFDCARDGTIDETALTPLQRDNRAKARNLAEFEPPVFQIGPIAGESPA